MAYMMNKQRENFHSGGPTPGAQNPGDKGHEQSGHRPPSIHIHSHAKGHTVHVHHQDGTHTKSEHSHGDTDGIAAQVHQHLGGSPGNVQSEGAPMPAEQEEFS